MFWRKPRATADEHEIEWILECWQWLDEVLGPVPRAPFGSFILPSRRLFPDTELKGHAKAEYYLRLVQEHSGLQDWPVDLLAQSPQPKLGNSIVFAPQSTSSALGTFRFDGNRGLITYSPDLLEEPMNLIATLIHELSHFVLLQSASPPPGGEELEELATDLAMAHLGFGLFGANSASSERPVTELNYEGWATSHSGYFSESLWSFSCALYAELLKVDAATYQDYVKPRIGGMISKNRAFLKAKPELVSRLQPSTSALDPMTQTNET